MARLGILTLEDDSTVVEAPVDATATTEITAAVQEDAAELGEATSDIATDVEVVDQNMEAVAEGEGVVDTIQVAVDNNGEGLTPETIAVAEDHIASIYRRLGAKPARAFPAIENFAGARANKVYHAKMALEDIMGTLKKAWEQIKAFFGNLVTKVVEWFKNLVQSYDRLEAASKAMQEKTKWISEATGLKLKKDATLKLSLLGLSDATAKSLLGQTKQEQKASGLKDLAGSFSGWGDANKAAAAKVGDFASIETKFMAAMTKAKASNSADAITALGDISGVFAVVDASAATTGAKPTSTPSGSYGYAVTKATAFSKLTDDKSVSISNETTAKAAAAGATTAVVKFAGEEKLDGDALSGVQAVFAAANFTAFAAALKAHKDTTKEIPSTTKLFGEFGNGDFKDDEGGAHYRVALNFAKAYTQVVNAQIATVTSARSAAYTGFKNTLVNVGAIANVVSKDSEAAAAAKA